MPLNNTENDTFIEEPSISQGAIPLNDTGLQLNKQNNDHELQLQKNQFSHEHEQKILELGCIGKLFGSGDNSSRNMAVTICIILLTLVSLATIGVFACDSFTFDNIIPIWDKIIPIITLSIGYLFGKKG